MPADEAFYIIVSKLHTEHHENYLSGGVKSSSLKALIM